MLKWTDDLAATASHGKRFAARRTALVALKSEAMKRALAATADIARLTAVIQECDIDSDFGAAIVTSLGLAHATLYAAQKLIATIDGELA